MASHRERVLPSEGQESVWDYPRPPACLRSHRRAVVLVDGATLADSRSAWRILETSHPPTWYFPPAEVRPDRLSRSGTRSTVCEWKGSATYRDVLGPRGGVFVAAAWSYEQPSPGYERIAGFLAFSPSRLSCSVDGEPVRAQEGGFYSGWITDDVVGPFKGGPGTVGW